MNDYTTVNKKVTRIGGYVAVVFLIGMISFIFWKSYEVRHHFAFTTGKVVDITKPGWKNSGDYSIVFEYSVNAHTYNGNNNYNYCSGQSMSQLKSLFVGKHFPVVYAMKDPSGGFMLFTQNYADRYKYKLPDSIRFYDSVLTCKQQ